MPSSNVNMLELLQAREERAARQSRFRAAYHGSLLSFSMNTPGPVKDTPLVRLAFYEGRRRLMARLSPLAEELSFDAAGPALLWAVDLDAAVLKSICEEMEERDGLGRLFDMDVLDAGGEKLSRSTPRRCLLCDEDARVCARSRRHGLDAVLAETQRRQLDFAASLYADKAVEALLEELYTTPKPGLVDRNNSGAHRDMDLPLFEKSARALWPYFYDALCIGYAAGPERESMERLRQRGVQGEKEMFAATGGVNTHKGMVYTLGLLLGGVGRAFALGGEPVSRAVELARSDFDETMAAAARRGESHGEKLYVQKGIRGIRGEAADGFPHARHAAARLSEGAAAVTVLLELMEELEDTNVLHRAGESGAALVKSEAQRILALPEAEREAALLKLDEVFTRENISPGGAADTLAAGMFLNSVRFLRG
ncbi:MAG: citrate lyase holo-[acyl-carrier protein] synthase [Ruminococcaceae bacterium]|nr:citrate lyase holo-[acyl-carrier protein] synthase [Oscillospiraceae bacterium]